MISSIDAHHHLWRYNRNDYPWIDESLGSLQRDFLPQDLQMEAESAGICGTVAVQARQTEEETHWLLDLAGEHALIRGVVGWVDLCARDCAGMVERLAIDAKLVGFRHVVQAEPTGFLDRNDFNNGISLLRDSGLAFDLLILEGQIDEAARFVDRHADQVFVLDHIGKPRIVLGEMEPWRRALTELARRPNVWCKVSGLVTEADWTGWTPETLKPYLNTVIEAFGPMRLMAGSDWPVCLAACGYTRWWDVLQTFLVPFTEAERASILGGCANDVYHLQS